MSRFTTNFNLLDLEDKRHIRNIEKVNYKLINAKCSVDFIKNCINLLPYIHIFLNTNLALETLDSLLFLPFNLNKKF